MPEKIEKEENNIDPVHLDSNQMQELDKLIGSLKKEIIHPKNKRPEESASSGAGYN